MENLFGEELKTNWPHLQELQLLQTRNFVRDPLLKDDVIPIGPNNKADMRGAVYFRIYALYMLVKL